MMTGKYQLAILGIVVPAKAGTQWRSGKTLGPRLRGDDSGLTTLPMKSG